MPQPAHLVIRRLPEVQVIVADREERGRRVEAYDLVNGVLSHAAQMDEVIQRHAAEWPLDQMAVIDRNILRIAIYEFIISQQTPVRVAINEAVELAKLYGADSAPRFVNGVLGALASKRATIWQGLHATRANGQNGAEGNQVDLKP